MNRRNRNRNNRGAREPKYISVFNQIVAAAEGHGISQKDYDDAIQMAVDALDNHPQHSIMTRDQEDCFVEYNTARNLFGMTWKFPGDLRPLEQLKNQSRHQSQPTPTMPEEQHRQTKRKEMSSENRIEPTNQGKKFKYQETSTSRETEGPNEHSSNVAIKMEDESIADFVKMRKLMLRREEMEVRKTFGDEIWEARVRREEESAYKQRDTLQQFFKDDALLQLINPMEGGKCRYSHVLDPTKEIRESISGDLFSLSSVEKALAVKIKVKYQPNVKLVVDFEPLDMEAAHKDNASAVKCLVRADEFLQFHTWCGTEDVREGRTRTSLKDTCEVFLQNPTHGRVRMWMDSKTHSRIGELIATSAF